MWRGIPYRKGSQRNRAQNPIKGEAKTMTVPVEIFPEEVAAS